MEKLCHAGRIRTVQDERGVTSSSTIGDLKGVLRGL
jgi:hypothetical protein